MILAITLAAFALVCYGPDLALEFIGDDYVFLDRVVHSRFRDLWSRSITDFGWYRPWSRDLHFWMLTQLFGPNPLLFRLASLMLWLADLLLFHAVLARFATRPAPAIATLGVGSLALWGAPMLWISGAQDLWMLFFAMLALLLFARGRTLLSALGFGLALLSKETAAVVPGLLFVCSWILQRQPWRRAIARTLPSLAVLAAWLVFHPTIRARVLSPEGHAVEVATRPELGTLLRRTAGVHFSLDLWPRPEAPDGLFVLQTLGSVVILVLGGRRLIPREMATGLIGAASTSRIVAFGALWALCGWAPVALPTIGWHAYYGSLGALGVWAVLGSLLARSRKAALTALGVLAVLRALHAETLVWDWGSAWNQRRAGTFVSAIRNELKRQHPAFPPHSRIYFGRIPNNIGLVAGRSPALRVWYGDSTLHADFFSGYAPRGPGEVVGRDYFFRFDTTKVLVELSSDPEDPLKEARENPAWAEDHEKLAVLFLESGDVSRAARQFELISRLPGRTNSLLLAAACWSSIGATPRASALVSAAASRLKLTTTEVERLVDELRGSMPELKPRMDRSR